MIEGAQSGFKVIFERIDRIEYKTKMSFIRWPCATQQPLAIIQY
jgi:hypothetical protein